MAIATIEEGLHDIRQGKMVILMDDKNRENEGDLTMAAEKVTPEAINFMATYGRGLICLSLTADAVDRLGLSMMVTDNTAPFGTAFTVSIDGVKNVTTGISAADRAETILTAIRDDVTPEELCTPGHIFPLRAREGGVLVRAGQTEGSVDLCRLAGLKPAGVICEIMKDDGTMARLPDLEEFGEKYSLKIVTIADLIQYRLQHDSLIFPVASAALPTSYGGDFKAIVYNTRIDSSEHLALIKGEISENKETLVRVCSKFLPGDVFGFALFDTGSVIKRSMEMIAEEEAGVLLYLQPEGKGLRPNEVRGDKSFREFGIGAQILRDLGVRKLRLITNNPKNLVGLSGYGLEVTSSVPFDRPQTAEHTSSSRVSTLKG